jgi:hypothetical protein
LGLGLNSIADGDDIAVYVVATRAGAILWRDRNLTDVNPRWNSPSSRLTFHRIRVVLKQSGYRLRYREGYWAIPPGEEALMTPAAAQLINNVRSGAVG